MLATVASLQRHDIGAPIEASDDHKDSNDMMPPMQSAYRRFHSTETAVTTVYSDLLLAADVGQVSALCLLDLTAAFDTVDHHSCTLAPSRASVRSAWCCSGLVRFVSDR